MLQKHKFSVAKFIKSFSFLTFCKNNAPQEELFYTGFGIFGIISTICTMYYISGVSELREQKALIYIYESMLVLSVCIVTYPVWPNTLKKDIIIQIIWNIGVFYLLIICSSFFVMLSNFAALETVVFTVNLIVVAILIRWKIAVGMIIVGLFLATQVYQYYTGVSIKNVDIGIKSSSFVLYAFLLIATAIIIFLKPKQEQQALTEEKVNHLDDRIIDREEELAKSLALKNEFLRNLEHELNTPITGIISMGQVLWESYDNLSDKQRSKAAEEIAKSSQRLISLTNKLLDLSRLSSLTYELHKTNVNFSKLVRDRVDQCKKLYLNNKELQFFTEIEPNIEINCDQRYITSTVDNLIINAIQYSGMTGKITVKLYKIAANVEFSIQDEGIGIPQNELIHIFSAFTVSSKTHTPAGGRGVGLALCEKAIKAHGGTIQAESNGKKGAKFKFCFRIN